MRQPNRKSKIVCTIGPSVHSEEKIMELIEAGMDIARLNFSHGSHEAHAQSIHWIRSAVERSGIQVGILADLQGPKIRTGKIGTSEGGISLKAGDRLFFKGQEKMDAKAADGSRSNPILISYASLAQDLRVGDALLFDDGLVKMQVAGVDPENSLIEAEWIYGKGLSSNKGVNMPGAKLSALGVTEKDWSDIQFCLGQDIDFFAMSFVRSAREIKNLKNFVAQKKTGLNIIAKIEKAEAIENIDDILTHSDGIMIARGDLGVEIGNENVPLIQKKLIRKARIAAKPVITATQMMMSMVESPTPTRAEASDVANAVLDGSDALMLSNETATGNHPIEVLKMMSKIIAGAEAHDPKEKRRRHWASLLLDDINPSISEAVDTSATVMAMILRARCLACLTRSGQTARLLAQNRPTMPIYAFAENRQVRAQLCLSWGVFVIPWKEVESQDYTIFDDLLKELGRLSLIANGELSVMTAGIPTTGEKGTTNTVIVKSYPPEKG